MAMNEDSVVSSLNELRRMANERARRETEARARVDERGNWDQRGQGGRRRTTEIQGGPAGQSATLMGGFDTGQAPQGGYGGYGYGYNHTAQPGSPPDVGMEPSVRQKSAAGPVLLTIILLGGAAGGGYWKLQQDWQAQLRVRDQALQAAEEARNKAVEQEVRAEQLAKVQIANCGKGGGAERAAASAAAASAPAAAAAVVPPASKPMAATKPAKVEKGKRARKAAARRALARAALPLAEEEKKPAAPMPKIAGKKKLNDDPLAGLKM